MLDVLRHSESDKDKRAGHYVYMSVCIYIYIYIYTYIPVITCDLIIYSVLFDTYVLHVLHTSLDLSRACFFRIACTLAASRLLDALMRPPVNTPTPSTTNKYNNVETNVTDAYIYIYIYIYITSLHMFLVMGLRVVWCWGWGCSRGL